MACTDFRIVLDVASAAEEVRTALARYTDEPGQADGLSFISTMTLYRLYRDWRAVKRHDPTRPPPLTRSEFGMILRRVFPRAKRRQRQFDGRQRWGYCHIAGPKCVRSPLPLFPRRNGPPAEHQACPV